MKIPVISVCASLLLSACQLSETAVDPVPMPLDPHSYADPAEAVVTHLSLNITSVDFDAHVLQALATLTFECHQADTLRLDTYGLEIQDVRATGEGFGEEVLRFAAGRQDEILGTELLIFPDRTVDGSYTITIWYKTSPGAKALQWLSPEQTNGKTHPFLFTQSQAILARTWIPLQDSPGIRFTYDASVQAPEGLLAVMSASNPQSLSEDSRYSFEMKQPIPSYLMALAVGDLRFQSTGPRTGVYAEPAILEASAWEFGETEALIQAAEALYVPYQWERYDLLVLPPSFPFGGMENPRLTFLTPTVIAGDRSLVALIAHELAHSWSGNLVTNGTWNDFWINEGFTVYFENRIMEAVYGAEYAAMLQALSHSDLTAEVADFLENAPNDTKLAIDLVGRNPDDGVTTIAYDKGFHFLRLIEHTVGREAFDAFLKDYFASYTFQSMTTDRFIGHLRASLLSDAQWEEIGGDEWIFGTGLPTNCPVVEPAYFTVVDAAATRFLSDGTLPTETDKWNTHQWLRFMNALEGLSADQVMTLDRNFHFTWSGNSEIFAAWAVLATRSGFRGMALDEEMIQFLLRVGRRKFLTPIYKALVEADRKDHAQYIYQQARPGYHAVAQETLDKLLGYKG